MLRPRRNAFYGIDDWGRAAPNPDGVRRHVVIVHRNDAVENRALERFRWAWNHCAARSEYQRMSGASLVKRGGIMGGTMLLSISNCKSLALSDGQYQPCER